MKGLEKSTSEELNTIKKYGKMYSPMPQESNKEVLEEAVEAHIKIARIRKILVYSKNYRNFVTALESVSLSSLVYAVNAITSILQVFPLIYHSNVRNS